MEIGHVEAIFGYPVRIRTLMALVSLLLVRGDVAAGPHRNTNDIPEARESLRRTVGAKLYRSLLISPVEGWIVVRGQLTQDRLFGLNITHSELNGTYDALALELAGNLKILDYTQSDTLTASRAVLVNLLIYHIADGRMALSFAHFAESGGSQMRYSGAAWMAVLRGNKWVPIEPSGLSPYERRGPRSYTMAVEAPGCSRAFSNGRLPKTGLTIQGGQDAATHLSPSR